MNLTSALTHVTTIGDLVEVTPVKTVIQLEEDSQLSTSIAQSFVFTSEVFTHYSILARAFEKPTGKGYFLKGDFGSGKSHFLAALFAWLAKLPGSETLTKNHSDLQAFQQTGKTLLPVAISLVKHRASTNLEQIIITSIEQRLSEEGHKAVLSPLARFLETFRKSIDQPALLEEFKSIHNIGTDEIDQWLKYDKRRAYSAAIPFLKKQGLSTPEEMLYDRAQTFSNAMDAIKSSGYDGVVLLIDELSEFLSAKSDTSKLNEDARTLQFIGEFSSQAPIWTVAAVQESIERTGDIAQQTLKKIKDRYPVMLELSTLHIRELVSRRLVRKKPNAINTIERIYNDYSRHFSAFNCSLGLFTSIYPIHPLTINMLEGLGELFSEHRGVVDFIYTRLVGDKSRKLSGILEHPAELLLAPDSIYDHFASRLGEFSAFHKYPRHIIPHLDDIIEQVLEDNSDKELARRLVRILVLYCIHPTSSVPNLEVMTELAACMISSHDPTQNARYIGEVILDPIVEHSRFLVKRVSVENQPDNVFHKTDKIFYEIVSEDDPSKTFKAKLKHISEKLDPRDSRLFLEPLKHLEDSPSWPGPQIWRETAKRSVLWRQTQRKAILLFLDPSNLSESISQIQTALEQQLCDFILAFTVDSELSLEQLQSNLDLNSLPLTIWNIPPPSTDIDVLRNYYAAKLILGELSPSNPAEAPLIPLAREQLASLEPLVQQVILNTIYKGHFSNNEIVLESSARQLKRFDRLLESASDYLLSIRYRKFIPLAPRGIAPSIRIYQRIFDELIVEGRLSIREARSRGLNEAIETLVLPLGLAEVKSGAYILNPDPLNHPLLHHILDLIPHSSGIHTESLLSLLRYGPFGIPDETGSFLIATLAYSGLISLRSRGKALPLDFLRLSSVSNSDEVFPGELITKADRETLQSECQFLADDISWDSFGLKQQRDAWHQLVSFKRSSDTLIADLQKGFTAVSEYSAFGKFNQPALLDKLKRLETLLHYIKVSYAAREGLEHFLFGWREIQLKESDISFLQQLRKFFLRSLDQFIFISHYVKHPSLVASVSVEHALSIHYDLIINLLNNPEKLIVVDNAEALIQTFQTFRHEYATFYEDSHHSYYEKLAPPKTHKRSLRMLKILNRLYNIESLDRPTGLSLLLKTFEPSRSSVCRRNVPEQLLRQPTCSCGFQIGQHEASEQELISTNIDEQIENALKQYAQILGSSLTREQLRARAFALKDMNKDSSRRLSNLCNALETHTTLSPTALLDALDTETLVELEQSLIGNTVIETRDLSKLFAIISGRRLDAKRINALFQEWIGTPEDNAIIAINGTNDASENNSHQDSNSYIAEIANLWPFTNHHNLFASKLTSHPISEGTLNTLETTLSARFPMDEIQPILENAQSSELTHFMRDEPCYTQSIQKAWHIITHRILSKEDKAINFPAYSSEHINKDKAEAISNRLKTLEHLHQLQSAPLPQKLTARLPICKILHDPWCNTSLRKNAESLLHTISNSGDDWLQTLEPISVIDLNTPSLVILVDAIAPDLWLSALASFKLATTESCHKSWSRLETEPKTVPSLCSMFGLPHGQDPLDFFASRGIVYENLEGNENHSLQTLLPKANNQHSLVLRLSLFDKAAHSGTMRISDMQIALQTLLTERITPLVEENLSIKRRVILTSDHGLTLISGKLSHGNGGVYERAILRLEWGGIMPLRS